MLRDDPARPGGAVRPRGAFVLYLEGAGDRGILNGWCRRLLPAHAGSLSRSTVILGGKRPARAVEHFRALGGAAEGRRALCVLDRDDGGSAPAAEFEEPGLEFFTWGRRHIESYLLVPDAIRRALRLPPSDGRVALALRDRLPDDRDSAGWGALDAKRLLARAGPVAQALGTTIPVSRVARATRAEELHEDVHAFFERLRVEIGAVDAEVVR